MRSIFVVIFMLLHFWASPQTRGGAIFFRMIYQNVPNCATSLRRLSPDSISGFSNSFYGFGSDGFYSLNRFRIGYNAIISGQGPSSKGNKYAEPVIGSAHISLGYVTWSNKKWKLGPHVGGGISGIQFSKYDKTASVISNLHIERIIRPSIDAGINLDWNVYKFTESIFDTYYVMGFRMGYRYSGSSSAWKNKRDDHLPTLTGSFTNNAFYAAISLGVGVFKNHRK